MDLSEQNFSDLLSDDDIQVDEEVVEQSEDLSSSEDLLGLDEIGFSSEKNDENDVQIDSEDDNDESETSNFIEGYLKEFGINDMSKIQIQNDKGEIEEVDFNSLSESEKLNIFKELADPGYNDYEKSVINYLRSNNVTLDQIINYYSQQAIQEYLSQHPEQIPQKTYTIDDYTDDEIYLSDLKSKYPEFSDDELVEKLETAKANTELFEKEVGAIKNNYRQLEEEQLRQQEALEAQNYQDLQNNLQFALSNFTQIELDPADRASDALTLEITDDDRNLMMRYLLERDQNGKSQLIRDLEDPNALIELAYYRTRERDNLTGLTRYWKNELANERKEKAKLQKELDKYKNKGKNSFVVQPENSENTSVKKTRSIADIYG